MLIRCGELELLCLTQIFHYYYVRRQYAADVAILFVCFVLIRFLQLKINQCLFQWCHFDSFTYTFISLQGQFSMNLSFEIISAIVLRGIASVPLIEIDKYGQYAFLSSEQIKIKIKLSTLPSPFLIQSAFHIFLIEFDRFHFIDLKMPSPMTK